MSVKTTTNLAVSAMQAVRGMVMAVLSDTNKPTATGRDDYCCHQTASALAHQPAHGFDSILSILYPMYPSQPSPPADTPSGRTQGTVFI